MVGKELLPELYQQMEFLDQKPHSLRHLQIQRHQVMMLVEFFLVQEVFTIGIKEYLNVQMLELLSLDGPMEQKFQILPR